MNKLHLIVRNQFPEFVREDYPVFVEFVKAYYKWLELQSPGKIEDVIDLDKTPEEFVKYFRSELDTYGIFNFAVPFNKLYLQRIKQIYAAKGSEQALVNILRIVYQAEAVIKYPSENILRASAGKWQQDSFITIEKSFGTLPQNITEFYVNYQFVNTVIPVNKFISVSPTRVRLYYTPKDNVALTTGQLISINDSNGVLAYAGKIVKSPSRLSVVNGGNNWQLGQVIVVPGTINNTIARVAEVDSQGAVLRVEILEHGYVHNENQLLTVSPYPNRPLGSTYSISSELISVNPVAYQHTLDVYDYTEGADEHTTGIMSGVGYGSYFLENYVDVTYVGDVVIDVSSTAIPPAPTVETDITMEQWLASRATFKYEFDDVTILKGSWKDESGQISNQTIRLQDNYYYQQYSYDIDTTTRSANYLDLANSVHPAGMKMFTTYNIIQNLEIIPIAETTYPFIRSDLLDVATINDNRIKRVIKPREDEAIPLDDIDYKQVDKYLEDSVTTPTDSISSFVTNKYFEDSVTALSDGASPPFITTYDAETYFAEDYAALETVLNIGA